MLPAGLRETDADTWSGASGERPQGRGLGKRPSGKWTKLGSDADSPPGKRAKTQVPGVKAANGECCLNLPIDLYILPYLLHK